ITLSEIATQFFFWGGLLLLIQGLRDEQAALVRWAGICWGGSALVRVDSLFLLPLLFLAHLLVRVVEYPLGSSFDLWLAFYQTVLPLFLLAILYFLVWNRPYFRIMYSFIWRVGAIAGGTLGALLVVGWLVLEGAHPWLTGKLALALAGVTLFGVTAYAYWIRPRRPKRSVAVWPGNPWHGALDYREDSLVNLARYLSPGVVWMGVVGWFLALWLILR